MSKLRMSALVALMLASWGVFACSAGAEDQDFGEDEFTEAVGEVQEALGGTCPLLCTTSTSCSQSCTIDAAAGNVTINCQTYGVCKPAPPAPTVTIPPAKPPCPGPSGCKGP